jgi:uncharacterized coiled-coil protein SlyX
MSSMEEIKSRAAQLPPVDENVKIPAAIRAAAARSDALHKTAYEAEGKQEEEDKGQEGHKQGEEGKQDGGTEGKQEKAKPEAGSEAKAGEKPAAQAPAASEWEHKYNSLKGRYDQQAATIRQLSSHVEQLQAEIAKKPVEPVRTPDNTIKGVTPEERETYGDDFLDVAARAAAEKFTPRIAELEKTIERLNAQVGTVAQVTTKTAQQQMYEFLDDKLPDWRKLNRDPNFLEWASLQDTLSGAIRMNMMRQAFGANDANRVLSFFKAYLSDEAVTAPVVPSQPTTPSGKVPLEELAAPGRAKAPAASSSATPGEKEKPIITRAQISQFYLDVNRGKYKGNDAEKLRLEKMIFDAENEGRVV